MQDDKEKNIEFPMTEVKGRLVNGKFRKKTMKQQLAEMTFEERQSMAASLVLDALDKLIQLPNGQVCFKTEYEAEMAKLGYKLIGKEITPIKGEIMEQKIIAEFSNVIGCERCSAADVQRDAFFNLPQPGFIGKNYAAHKVIFIGQNPGTSPDHFAAEDKLYADLLLKLRQEQDSAAYSELYEFLQDFMQKWQVNKSYFPLDECGLRLEDIAYFNLVRCRTRGNAVPIRNVTSTCMNHFLNWIKILSPAVIVCIGKNPYDGISQELEKRGIPCYFINRAHNRSNSERQINRNNAGNFVKNVLSSKPVVTNIKEESPKMSELNSHTMSPKTEMPKQEEPLACNTEYRYRKMLKSLGFDGEIILAEVLRYKGKSIRLYFNRNTEGKIYFTASKKDISRYPTNLWSDVDSWEIKIKDKEKDKINLVPHAGKEEEAFRKLLGY